MPASKRRFLAASLLCGMAFLSAIFALQGSLLNSIINSFCLTDSLQGIPSSVAFAGGIVAFITAFVLIGRIPKLRLLEIAIGICCIFLVALRFSSTFWVFVLLWFFLGFGMGLLDTLLSSCTADLYPGESASGMLCILHTFYGIASVITPLLYAKVLTSSLNWKVNYLYVAIAGCVLVVYTIVVASRSGNSIQTTSPEQKLSLREMGKILRTGALPLLIGAMFFHGFFLSGLNTWIIRYVGVTMSSNWGNSAMSFLFFGVMISRLAVPILKIPVVKFVRYCGFIGAFFLLIGIFSGNGLIMCICTCLSGISFGALVPCILSLGCSANPGNTLFATTSLMLSLYIGEAFSTPIIGALETAFNLHAGMILCGILMVVTSLFSVLNRSLQSKPN